MDELKLEYLRLDNLMPTKENAKLHDLQMLAESFYEHGFKVPIVVWQNKKTFQILAGHGRVETLLFLLQQERPLPKGILEDEDGMWMVPSILGVDPEDLESALGFLVDDNNLTMLGGNFTHLDISRAWDREKYIKLLTKAVAKTKTVDHNDLQLLIEIDKQQIPTEDEEEAETFDQFGNKETAFRTVLIFSTEDKKEEFVQWVKGQRDFMADSYTGDLVLKNIS